MRRLRVHMSAVAVVCVFTFASGAIAQEGIKRAMLQQAEVPPGTHTSLATTIEVAPRLPIGRHTHPGVEMGYVLEGEGILSIEGAADRALKAGDSYQVPANVPHGGRNTGDTPLKVVVFFVVEKGKPLAAPIAATGQVSDQAPK